MEISMTVTPYIANTDIHGHVNSSTGFPVIETLNAEFQSRKWVNPVPQVTFRDWEVDILKRDISRIRKISKFAKWLF